MVGDDLHGQVGVAIGGAAAHRRAHAGSIFRVDPIHVERDVVAGGAAAGHAQRLFDDGAHAALINIAHGEDFDAGAENVFFFRGVHIAHAHQHAIFRRDFRRKSENIGEIRRPQAGDGRQRHAVNVAAGRSLRRIHVAVRVNPDEPCFLVLPPVEFGDAGHATGSDGVVAPQDQRNLRRFQRLHHQFGVLGAGGSDLFQVLGGGLALLLLLGDGHGDIAGIFHHVSDGLQSRLQAGNAHR